MGIRDKQRAQSSTPNFAAMLAVFALILIWRALSPIWLPGLAWLLSFFEPVLLFVGRVLLLLGGLFMVVMFGLVVAVVALLLGGGRIGNRVRL